MEGGGGVGGGLFVQQRRRQMVRTVQTASSCGARKDCVGAVVDPKRHGDAAWLAEKASESRQKKRRPFSAASSLLLFIRSWACQTC